MKQLKNCKKIACTFLFLLLFISVLQLQSQDVRKVENFNSISFNISGDLYIEQGNEFSLKLDGNDKDLEKIITDVDGNSLVIKTKNHNKISGDVKVYVTLPILKGVNLAGSGDVLANKTIKTENIKLSISGSGDILFKDLQTGSANIIITGSGDIEVIGKPSEKLKIGITGSGSVNAVALEAKNVDVNITGSGSVKVFATQNLETEIVGSGSVLYKGAPLIDANSVGSGKTKSIK